MSTTIKPEPTSKPKHWTEKPDLVTSVHKVAQELIDDHKLIKSLSEDWTPETFIADHNIDLTQTLTDVRKAIRSAVMADFRADLLSLYEEVGITDVTVQQAAHPPYDTLDEAIEKMAPTALRNMIGLFVAATRNKQHIDSLHKEQPKMDTTNLADVFDPAKTDEQVKAALKAAELDLTGSPDEPTSPKVSKSGFLMPHDEPTSPIVSVNPVMMALEQIKDEREAAIAANPDKIEGLRKELIATLFDAFPGVSNAALKVHMTTALKASTFSDFILRYKTIEEAGSAGKELINGYIDVAAPPRATEPLPSAPDTPSRNLPATTNNRVINVDASHLMTGNPQWDTRVMQAQMMISSGLMPEGVDTIEKVLTIGMMGEQLGIPMIVAVNNIDVIKGKPSIKPQLMLALIRRSGQLENLSIEDDGNACTVKMKRKGETEHVSTFSVQDATRMYLTKNQWVTQPATMRKWRAISAACRVVFPDHIWGFYMPEELDPNVIVVEE